MKRDRNARKELLDLYLYMDMKCDSFYEKKASNELKKHYEEIKKKFDKIYGNRYFGPMEWNEYYGLFKLDDGRIGIDPKRMSSKIRNFGSKQLEIMNNRKTTYFHPKKRSYLDYYVNNFVSVIRKLKEEFNNIYVPIIKRTAEDINKKRKVYTPADVGLFMEGIYEYDEACMSAQRATWRSNAAIDDELYETIITLLVQFFHSMASRIEAASVSVYSKINPQMKKWSRDKLYDNINLKGMSSRDLPSIKYHNQLYLIWNFIKHNNLDTYENLKKEFPELLIKDEYKAGEQAKYYVKINEKLIIKLLDGTEKFFKDWCELNCDENYREAQWNYDDYFKELVSDTIEMYRNPLGLEF